MIALIQRVSAAKVEVDGKVVGEIGRGISVFVGIQQDDTNINVERLVTRTLGYRLFPDERGRMSRSVVDIHGDILIVSQFTLAADTQNGLRASYTTTAPTLIAQPLYDSFVMRARAAHNRVATGTFAADMQVSLCNDGPVSFILRS